MFTDRVSYCDRNADIEDDDPGSEPSGDRSTALGVTQHTAHAEEEEAKR